MAVVEVVVGDGEVRGREGPGVQRVIWAEGNT